MHKRVAFRKDIQRKLIFFTLVPMFAVGVLGSLLIYQAEISLMKSEHVRLLRVVERLTSDYFRRVHLLFNVVHNKITDGKMQSVDDGFDFSPELSSIIETDLQGTIRHIRNRYHSLSEAYPLNPHLQELISQLLANTNPHKGMVYYSRKEGKTLLAHAFRYEGSVYLIQADPQAFFDHLRYFLQKEHHRLISIVNKNGKYIYNSFDQNLSQTEASFYKQGAYAIAVKNQDPYTVTEFPAHYQAGDSFWKGLFDDDNFLSYAHLPDFNWIVTVWDHEDALDQYLAKVLMAGLVLMASILILTAISAQIMSDRIVRPVEKIIQRINDLTMDKQKDHGQIITKTYPIFQSLTESFETMRRKIIAREQKLEAQIESNAQMQKQLVQQEKLAAMGEMIGNIAHQWRQPLSVISTLATGMKAEQELRVLNPEDLDHLCTQINSNAQYLSGTIDDFRQFIKGDHEKKIFDAQGLISSLQSLLGAQFKRHNIDFEVFIEEGLQIHGYRNDLIQVLINLLNNAKDAFSETREEDRYIVIRMKQTDAGGISIRVLDDGGGIDEAIIHRVFEPYFTTKEKSQGTGLGLHMVYRMIFEGMGGSISVETVTFTYREQRVKGAEFTILLPPASEDSDSGKEKENHETV